MTIKERAKRLKTDIPAVFIAMKKKETPWVAKLLAAIVVAYALSPIDLIPDFIPVLGLLDDVLLLPALIALILHLIPREVWAQCQAESESLWRGGSPKRWYYALPIVLVWALLLFLTMKLFIE